MENPIHFIFKRIIQKKNGCDFFAMRLQRHSRIIHAAKKIHLLKVQEKYALFLWFSEGTD